MNKKLLQKISLIISVLGLIYLILSHYEIIRYVNLHFYDTNNYIERYKNLKNNDKKIIVSFTCKKEKLNSLKSFINSILDQSCKVNEIILAIQENDVKYIPAWLSDIVTVQKYTLEYGNNSSLICSLLKEREADSQIIIVNPNKVFSSNSIGELIDDSKENPDKIILSDNAYLIKPDFFDCKVAFEDLRNFTVEKILNKFSDKKIKKINLSNIYPSFN
jgi:hypothetical protein